MKKRVDVVKDFNGSRIQHGHLNSRIYLMKIGNAEPERLSKQLLEKAEKNGYSKIFTKIPKKAGKAFLDVGYQIEANVPGFYMGIEDALFLGYYLSKERRREKNKNELEKVLLLSEQKNATPQHRQPPRISKKLVLRKCTRDDVRRMAEIYSKVFLSYPFPIHDPSYLTETMHSHVDYFCVEANGQLIALSSSEYDFSNKNAEMTDFATLPKWRGYGLAKHLLAYMEKAAKSKSIVTAYTIARAISPSMNITFAQMGYQYGGCLTNNTNISGSLESMNVWYKSI